MEMMSSPLPFVDDLDETPFTISMEGIVFDSSLPEIAVEETNAGNLQSGVTVVDFGNTDPSLPPPTRTFTIYSQGRASLTISDISAPVDITLSGFPTTPFVLSNLGDSQTFVASVTGATSGIGDITIDNNDGNGDEVRKLLIIGYVMLLRIIICMDTSFAY